MPIVRRETVPAAPESPRPGPLPAVLAADEGADRARARIAAYELVEVSQNECASDRIAALLDVAVANEWHEVAFMLHVARLARVLPQPTDTAEHLAALFAEASASDDLALTAMSLALQACAAAAQSVSTPEDEGALARAVAMLADLPAPSPDRPAAYVACGQAYQMRGLWELEEEMYALAWAELARPSAPQHGRVTELARRIVLMNRLEARLAGACALLEVGRRDEAARLARHEQVMRPEDEQALPHQFAANVAAVRCLLDAIAGLPGPDSLADPMLSAGDPVWPGYRACFPLAEAVRRYDAGDVASAATLAERTLPDLGSSYLPTVRTLALHLAAAADAAPAARRYAAELAQMRWDTRLGLLSSARARLEAERVMLENERLAERAYVDELTGLANRHAYSRQIARMRRGRADHSIAVLMVDVDRFKLVNDQYGHGVGDEVLRRMGSVLLEASRVGDLVARIGGDEFVIVFDQVEPAEASVRGEELVAHVAAQRWGDLATGLAVTVSVGLACGPAHAIDDLLSGADDNLYRAKASGRGRLIRDSTAAVLARLDWDRDTAPRPTLVTPSGVRPR